MNLKRKLIYLLRMRRHRSTVPTGLVPLSDMHTAVMYLDSADDLQEPQKVSIRAFFRQYGITLSFLHAEDDELRTDSDLFVSLSIEGGLAERYSAVTSKARFKIGRHQLKGDIYDFIVTDTAPEPVPAWEAFKVIEHFILNIQ